MALSTNVAIFAKDRLDGYDRQQNIFRTLLLVTNYFQTLVMIHYYPFRNTGRLPQQHSLVPLLKIKDHV